jgi:hypothetical protein
VVEPARGTLRVGTAHPVVEGEVYSATGLPCEEVGGGGGEEGEVGVGAGHTAHWVGGVSLMFWAF